MNYKLFGHDVRIIFIWQMILGVLTNLLIYLVARRYFGDFTATLSAIMAVFCGQLIFYELVLLRSSMTVFFGIFVVWLFGVALDKNKYPWWLLFGFVTGMAILLQIYFVFFLFGGILLLARTLRKQYKQLFVYTGCLIAGTIIAMSPAVMRNAIVGAPLLSLNSNGATTFITDNNVTVRSFVGWAAAVRITAEIMGSSDGHLIKAIILTL